MSEGSNRPSHRVIIDGRSNKKEGQKPFWITIGSVWPNKSGNGFNINIPEGISVTGTLHMVPFDDEGEAEE